ncbi:MAG: HD domain-containing protein, partial [Candidatus Sumerlaeota bacterium]|nr:HD domain-containing protein [Candidatus Sumerlaeota bacterium]
MTPSSFSTPSTRREKLFRDPVHDLVAFNLSDPREALLLRLIDTPEFQRLRRIRQLGMAYLAYPGAEHTRFGHAIGVAVIARRMLEELGKHARLDEAQSFACLVAALLHDVGHGPFSHIMERYLGFSHEERAVEILLSESTSIHRCLAEFDPSLPERVAALARGNPSTGAYGAIISSQLDADRMDYLLRDSLMTGVKYGIYDLERILKMLRMDEAGGRIVLSAKGLMPLEKYLQSRYHMYRQVYFHKAVTAAEVLLASLLRRAGALALKGALAGADDPDSRLGRFL